MYSKSDNMEIIISIKEDEVIKELFQSLFSSYQIELETLTRSFIFALHFATLTSCFIFDFLHLLYYTCHKTNFKWDRSYIATINLINKKDNKCVEYAITVALNHEE